MNYIKQLQHTPDHRRHGAPIHHCTSPKGLTRIKQAYNELVQAYRVLHKWAAAPPANAAVAATKSNHVIQPINLPMPLGLSL